MTNRLISLLLLETGSKVVKNPAMQESQVPSLDWEDPMQEKMATHSQYSYLENSTDRGAWRATVNRVAKNQT